MDNREGRWRKMIPGYEAKRQAREEGEAERELAAARAETRRKAYEVRPAEEMLSRGMDGVVHGGVNPVTAVVWIMRDERRRLEEAAMQVPSAEAWVVLKALMDLETRVLDAVDAAHGRRQRG